MLPFLYKYILPIAFLLVFISEHSLSQDTSKINLLPKDSVIVAKDSAVVKDTAAVKIDTASIDYRFKVAIQTGFDGKYSKSIAMCKRILKEKPDYHEVRLFMGRAYAWDHQWENAKKEISKVIEKEPKNVDAYNAITDVGLWSLIPEMALEKANKGLTIDSVNQDLMLKKAKALEQLGDIACLFGLCELGFLFNPVGIGIHLCHIFLATCYTHRRADLPSIQEKNGYV